MPLNNAQTGGHLFQWISLKLSNFINTIRKFKTNLMGKPYKLMTEEEKSSFNRYCIQRWRQRKLDAVEYKGGKCEQCGYNKYPDVLEFHHLNPTEKEASWNEMRKWNWEKVLTELDKCSILCANCHREVHVEQRLGK